MSYSLADLPLERVNRKKGLLIFSGVVAAIAWLLTLLMFAVGGWKAFFSHSGFVYLLFWDVAAVWMFVSTYRRHSRLLIDAAGIHVTVNGRTLDYLWPDIDRVNKVVVDVRSGATVAQIVRKGQIVMDKQTDLIWGEFGLSVEDVQGLVAEGKAKWGAAAAA